MKDSLTNNEQVLKCTQAWSDNGVQPCSIVKLNFEQTAQTNSEVPATASCEPEQEACVCEINVWNKRVTNYDY